MKCIFTIAVLVLSLLSMTDARKFNEETRNKALRNTRRVQQSYGSPRQIYWNFDKHFWRLEMRPPALEIGLEYEQSQPTAYKYVTTGPTSSQTYKMRVKLRGKGAVNLNSRFNIDRLFYNELTFELDEVIAYLFADLIVIYKDLSITSTNPLDYYNTFNLCFATGYNYQDISMSAETILKFPNCHKMLVQSLCDWTQWTDIIMKPGKQAYIFGLLDSCTMSDDSPLITVWDYQPVKTDTGDVYFAGNNIYSAPSVIPAVYTQTNGAYNYYYNTPNLKTANTWCLLQ